MEKGRNLVRREGAVVKISFAVTEILTFGRRSYIIFYNIMFVGCVAEGLKKILVLNFLNSDVHVDTVE